MEHVRMGAGIAAPNLVNICVDNNREGAFAGRIYHYYAKTPGQFDDVMGLLRYLEEFYDNIDFPQAAVQLRNFVKKTRNEGEIQPPPARVQEKDAVTEKRGKEATFLLYVQYRQNATWQGELMWAEREQSLEFRSALELIMLIDNALSALKEAEQQE